MVALNQTDRTATWLWGRSCADLNRTCSARVAARLKQLVSAMDILTLTNHRAGLPLSFIEAMALAKPVVATAVGEVPEIVIPGANGYLHQPENRQELAAAIIDPIDNPQTTALMGAPREHVRKSYSVEHFAAGMTRAYMTS